MERPIKRASFVNNKEIKTKKSYGVSICRFNVHTGQYEMLMVKKRCTYNFVEFVLGHYTGNNRARLLYLFNGMTNDEKLTIMSLDYGNIYYKVFLTNPDSPQFNKDGYSADNLARYKVYKQKFMDAFVRDGGQKLRDIVEKSTNIETIWEIPKGRKSDPKEKELNCAVRETMEETGVTDFEYNLLMDISPRRMTHMDVNIRYSNWFYIAVIKDQTYEPQVSFKNMQQVSEVVNMAWMTLDQIKNMSSNKILYDFVKTVFKLLKKKENIGKLTRLGLI